MVANPLWLMLGALALMVSLPFLNPVHARPITTFYEEALAIGLGLAALAFAGLCRGIAIRVPRLAFWIAALGVFVLLQPLVIRPAYDELPQIAALYLLWAAAIMCAGATLTEWPTKQHAQEIVAASILAAAVLSVIAAPQTMLGLLNHGNLQANFLVVGIACVAYLWEIRRLPSWLALGSLAVLGTGLAFSGSRASLLELAWLGGWFWYSGSRRQEERGSHVLVALALVVVVMIVWTLVPSSDGTGARIASRVSRATDATEYSYRLQQWEAAIRAWIGSPWIGVGVGGYTWAHFTTPTPWIGAVAMRPEINAHNLLLQLLAETGVVGAGIVVAGISGWGFRAVRQARRHPSPALAWAVAVVGVELVHSAVEFPLWQAEFLGLAALAAGMSDPLRYALKPAWLGRGLVLGAALLGAGLLFSTVQADERIRAAASREGLDDVRGSLLRPYVDIRIALSVPLTPEDLETKLAFNEGVMRTWPIEPIVQRQIVYLAMAGRDEEGAAILEDMLRLAPETGEQLRRLVARLPDSSIPGLSPLRLKLKAFSGEVER